MEDEATDSDENRISDVEDDNDSDYEANEKLTLKAKKLKRSHGKWKLYYENRVFKKEWTELFPWVEEDPDDARFAICRACNKKIKAHKGILETHQKTKRHLKNLSGSDDIDDEEDEPKKNDKSDMKSNAQFSLPLHGQTIQPAVEQVFQDDQFSFFTESPMDAAHQALTNLIDKLVDKYHDQRVENLKIQNDTLLQLAAERASFKRAEKQREYELHLQKEAHKREVEEVQLKLMQQQHESRINAMEIERDAKLRAVEQELMFARQEYEKKMKLLDVQLSCMK